MNKLCKNPNNIVEIYYQKAYNNKTSEQSKRIK